MSEKKEEKPLELYWIEFCYDELIGSAGLQPNIKEFTEGYHRVRQMVEEKLDD